MKSNTYLLSFILLVYLSGCGVGQSSKTTDPKDTEYNEDISAYRAQPMKPVEEERDTVIAYIDADSTSLPVNDRLNIVLDTAAAYNKATTKYIDGFTVQVYGGNDRTRAQDFRLDIIRNFPDVEPKMVFEQPNYKVRIGQYYTRLEAQELFMEIKTVFPRAILIPTRISVRN